MSHSTSSDTSFSLPLSLSEAIHLISLPSVVKCFQPSPDITTLIHALYDLMFQKYEDILQYQPDRDHARYLILSHLVTAFPPEAWNHTCIQYQCTNPEIHAAGHVLQVALQYGFVPIMHYAVRHHPRAVYSMFRTLCYPSPSHHITGHARLFQERVAAMSFRYPHPIHIHYIHYIQQRISIIPSKHALAYDLFHRQYPDKYALHTPDHVWPPDTYINSQSIITTSTSTASVPVICPSTCFQLWLTHMPDDIYTSLEPLIQHFNGDITPHASHHPSVYMLIMLSELYHDHALGGPSNPDERHRHVEKNRKCRLALEDIGVWQGLYMNHRRWYHENVDHFKRAAPIITTSTNLPTDLISIIESYLFQPRPAISHLLDILHQFPEYCRGMYEAVKEIHDITVHLKPTSRLKQHPQEHSYPSGQLQPHLHSHPPHVDAPLRDCGHILFRPIPSHPIGPRWCIFQPQHQ